MQLHIKIPAQSLVWRTWYKNARMLQTHQHFWGSFYSSYHQVVLERSGSIHSCFHVRCFCEVCMEIFASQYLVLLQTAANINNINTYWSIFPKCRKFAIQTSYKIRSWINHLINPRLWSLPFRVFPTIRCWQHIGIFVIPSKCYQFVLFRYCYARYVCTF